MKVAILFAIPVFAWAVAPAPAFAQAATETAILTGTTGSATAQGGRAVGSSVGGAMGRVGEAISGRGSARGSPRRNARRTDNPAVSVIGEGDPLEGSDAQGQELASGASIKVSGGLRPRAPRSIENPAQDAQAQPAPAE